MIKVPNTKIIYDEVNQLISDDNGITWHFTFSGLNEFLEMHPTSIRTDVTQSDDSEREIFGETLDEPIPDDLWEMLIV